MCKTAMNRAYNHLLDGAIYVYQYNYRPTLLYYIMLCNTIPYYNKKLFDNAVICCENYITY